MSLLPVILATQDYDFQKEGNFNELGLGALKKVNVGLLHPFALEIATQDVTSLKLVQIEFVNGQWIETTETDLTSQISTLIDETNSSFVFTKEAVMSTTPQNGYYSIHFTNDSIKYKTEIYSYIDATLPDNIILAEDSSAILAEDFTYILEE